MVIRLSAEAIQIKHGRKRYSQNMTYAPWQATTQKNGKKNRNNRVHKPKPKLPQNVAQIKEQEAPASSCTDISEPLTIGKFTAAFREEAQRNLDTRKQRQKGNLPFREDMQKFLDKHELQPEEFPELSMESLPTRETSPTMVIPHIQKYIPLHQMLAQDVREELERLGARPEDLTPRQEHHR